MYKNQEIENIMVVDVETGGVNSKTDGLCSVTCKVLNKNIYKTIYVSPNDFLEYHMKAFEVNGLSIEKLEEIGKSENMVVAEIIDFITKNYDQKPMLLGQNVHFDIRFLQELFERNGMDVMRYVDYHYLDIMVFSGFCMLTGLLPRQSVSLGDIHELLFKEKIQDHHTSEADVFATERIFNYYLKVFKENLNGKIYI